MRALARLFACARKRRAFGPLPWLVAVQASQPLSTQAQDSEYGASANVRAETALGTTAVDSVAASARPGALGEPARALFDAPGAVRGSFLGGELILWGAAPSESRSYVDGVEIPYLFHPTGLRSTVHPALIERVTVTPGAPPADYGRALGGAVDVTTIRLRSGVATSLRADGIDTSLSAAVGNQRVRALVGARYGYFDRVLARLAPDSQGRLAVPAHQDGVARVEVRVAADTRLSATWIGARDTVALSLPQGPQQREHQFHVGSLRLERRYGDGAHMQITPFVGMTSSREQSAFGDTPLRLEKRGSFFGLRADYTRSVSLHTVRLGVDARTALDRMTRQGTLSLPAREGDVRVFGQVPIDELDSDRFHVGSTNVAPWAALALRFGAFTVTPSFRLETYLLSVDRSQPALPNVPAVGHDSLLLYPEPRLSLAYRAAAWLSFEARTGLHHQAPDPSDLSATFGTPTLVPASAWQSSLAARVALPYEVVLDVVAFGRELHALAVRTDLSPAESARQLEAAGHGSARGASLSLRRELPNELFFLSSYTLSRSQRSDPSGALRPFDFDQRHVMSSLLGYVHAGFLASVRARVATGAPRTLVTGTYLDSKTGRSEPLFGAHNAARLPSYFALDVHLEYAFVLPVVRLSLFADVLNATDQTNVEELAYTANYRARRDVTSIPVVAMAGLGVSYADE